MTAPRMLAPMRFAYADLVDGPPPLDRVPFPKAGLPEPLPGMPDLAAPWVYDADLLFGPAVATGAPPKLRPIALRNGLVAPPYVLPLLEGARYHVFLDAWAAPAGALHAGGAPWRHPGPPRAAELSALKPGAGFRIVEEHGIAYQLVPVPCTRFAWWRRLEVLVEVLASLYERLQPVRVHLTRAVGWADYVNRLIAAVAASAPVLLVDPELRDALAAIRRQEVRLLLALDGRGTPERPLPPAFVRLLQQHANVSALVFDLLTQPAFHQAIESHHALLPDEARSLIPTALALQDLVPPARGPGVAHGDGPGFGQRLVGATFEPWLAEDEPPDATGPYADLRRAALAARISSPGPWSILKACGRFAFALVVPAVRPGAGLGALLGRVPRALEAVAATLSAAGDGDAGRCATDLGAALRAAAVEAQALLERRIAAGIAGSATGTEAAMEFLRGGVTDEIDRISRAMSGWKLANATITEKFRKTDGVLVATWAASDAELDRAFEVGKSALLTKSFWGVVPVIDIAWQTLYLYAAYASTDFDAGLDTARFLAVDALTGLGNLTGSAGGILSLWTTTRRAHELASSLGRVSLVLGFAAAGFDLAHFVWECPVEVGPSTAGYRAEDTERLRYAYRLTMAGKIVSCIGAAASAVPLAAVALSGLGAFLDYAGQVATHVLAGGARTAAAYVALEARLRGALADLAGSGSALGSAELVDETAVDALERLCAYGGFRGLDPTVAVRYGLVDGER